MDDGGGWDFIDWLGPDVSNSVLMCLDEPGDIVRASAVSRAWRHFVIANGFCKNLLIRLHPEVANFAQVIEVESLFEPIEVGPSNSTEWENREKEHKVYALLAHCLKSPPLSKDCILQSIAASSTDNYPDEGIENTLVLSNHINMRPSYWSSSGKKDPRVPETLTYRLNSNLCVVNEIKIRPFQAYFQHGDPIYSAQAVRFRMGHSMLHQEIEINNTGQPTTSQPSSSDPYVWTYVSPTYPMVQENSLQSFKLPRPVVCTGGVVQIELLGRIQQQEEDGLYYICMSRVQVFGWQLPPAFDLGLFDTSWRLALKYFPHARNDIPYQANETRRMGPSGLYEMILSTLLWTGNADDDDWEDDRPPS